MTKNGGLRNICFGEYLLRMSPVEQRPDNTHLLSHSCPTGSSHGPAEKKERLKESETIFSFSLTFVFSQMSETLIAIIDVFLCLSAA